LRDHADETSDIGVVPNERQQIDLIGYTPTTISGAVTLATGGLVDLIARQSPIMIDVALDTWGRSIPGAVGMQGSGHWAEFSDQVHRRFCRAIDDLTHKDKSAPIVVFCVNAERFTGYNLASRLVALGYNRVYWYRGGFEAWQANGLPDADLSLLPW
jgi:rhodanese-related sulfurtransferase